MAKRMTVIANRYARALFAAADHAQLDVIESSLTAFVSLWNEHAGLRAALKNPAVPAAQRLQVVADLATLIRSESQILKNFLLILMDKNRIELAPLILSAFSKQVAAFKRWLSVEVESAFPLSAEEQNELNARLSREFGSMANVSWSVNQGLIGGLRIRIGDKLLDSSIEGRLRRLEQVLSNN